MTAEQQMGRSAAGAKLWAARVAWIALTALALWLWSYSSVVIIREPRPPAAEATDPGLFTLEDTETLRQMGLPEGLTFWPIAFFLLLSAACFFLGGWIFWRRSADWMALLLSLALVLTGTVIFSYAYEVFNRGYALWLLLLNLLTLLEVIVVAMLLYLFPDGKFVPSWTRFVAPAFTALLAVFYLPLPPGLGQVSALAAMLGIVSTGLYARVYRYRRHSTPVERQQTKWVGLGLLAIAATIAGWFPALLYLSPDQPSTTRVYFLLILLPLGGIVGLLFPISVAISVLRYRLWHIDIYVNRTAVYGPLSGILMGLYAGCIRIFQGLFLRFTGEESDVSILLSTLALAGAFWPLRQRFQALADRYFKETPDPSKGLRILEAQMRSAAQLSDRGHVTRRLLDETMAAFHAESGAVFLQQASELQLAQTAGAWSGVAAITVPLQYAERGMGELALGPRHRGQDYTPQDRETLRGIADAAAQALALRSA